MHTKNTTRVTRTCLACGASFTVQASYVPRGAKFCNRACYRAYHKTEHPQSVPPEPLTITQPDVDFFWSRVERTDTCWRWTGAILSKKYPYGRTRANGKLVLAHRFSYELHKGAIPESLVLDHLCRNLCCVNPEHLEAVTVHENILRGKNGWKVAMPPSHCPHGHAYTPDNTKIQKSGTRVCRVCARATSRRCYADKRAREMQNQTTN